MAGKNLTFSEPAIRNFSYINKIKIMNKIFKPDHHKQNSFSSLFRIVNNLLRFCGHKAFDVCSFSLNILCKGSSTMYNPQTKFSAV